MHCSSSVLDGLYFCMVGSLPWSRNNYNHDISLSFLCFENFQCHPHFKMEKSQTSWPITPTASLTLILHYNCCSFLSLTRSASYQGWGQSIYQGQKPDSYMNKDFESGKLVKLTLRDVSWHSWYKPCLVSYSTVQKWLGLTCFKISLSLPQHSDTKC